MDINRNEDNNFPAGHNSADTWGMTMSIDQRLRTNHIREQPDKFQIGNETHSAHSGDVRCRNGIGRVVTNEIKLSQNIL